MGIYAEVDSEMFSHFVCEILYGQYYFSFSLRLIIKISYNWYHPLSETNIFYVQFS